MADPVPTMPPRPPVGLRKRARSFWLRMVGEYDFSPAELEILAEAARCLDTLEVLDRAIRKAGPIVADGRGGTRVNPAASEARQLRLTLGRLLAQLDLPDDDAVTSPRSASARKAARTRWNQAKKEA